MWDCGAEPILQINTDYLTYDQQPEPKALEEQGLRGNVFYFEQYKEAWIKCKHSLWSTSNNNFIQFSQRRSNRSSWCSDQTHFSLIWIGDGCRGLAGTLRHVSNKNWAAQMLETAHSITSWVSKLNLIKKILSNHYIKQIYYPATEKQKPHHPWWECAHPLLFPQPDIIWEFPADGQLLHIMLQVVEVVIYRSAGTGD